MTAWATDLEFAYDHGHLYVVDAESHWSEAEVDVRMPRSANFFVPLRVEGWGGRPPLDLDGWDHVTEFSLKVASGKLALASAGIDEVTVGIAPGAYRARWSGRNLSEAATWEGDDPPDSYRLQIWPGPTEAPRAEIKHWPGNGRSELGDLPALLADEDLDALGAIVGSERTGDALRLNVRLAGANGRSWDRTIRADGVVRWVVSSSRFHRAALHASHPGLLPFADDFGGLSFHGRPADPARLAHALRAAHAELADALHRLRGGRQRAARRRGAAGDRLRPARQRPGDAAAALRRGRGGARRPDAADGHGPGPQRPVPARARRDLRGRRALHRRELSPRWRAASRRSFSRFSPLASTTA